MRIRPIATRLFGVALASSLFLSEANAAPADPSALVTELGAQVKLLLGDGSLTPIERQQHFRVLLDRDFDFPTISRFVLGRYWRAIRGSW
jgi:ABC-type transporter MlaC component